MMRRMLGGLRRLAPTNARGEQVRPAYDDATCAALWHVAAGTTTAELASRLVGEFDARVTPKLLPDVASMFDDRGRNSASARWVDRACTEALEAVNEGLIVYGARVAPLRPGFPWEGLPDEGTSVDLLRAVRPHRFAFVTRYALAVCGGALPPEDLLALLEDWMRFASARSALPFSSNLVATQRLLACTWACAILAGAARCAELECCRLALLRIVAADAQYLRPRLGESAPNNHLLLDRFAGWFMASLYPELGESRRDAAALEAAWLAELRRQTYPDGGSFEHSTHYHAGATEMAVAYLLLKRRHGAPPGADCVSHVARMLRLQSDLSGPDGNAPAIGDGSEDRVFALDAGRGPLAPAFREILRALFDATVPPVAHDQPSIEWAFWLLGGHLPEPTREVEARSFALYPDSGIAIFFDDAEATRCTFRTGPMPHVNSVAGHAHADLLSIALVWHGAPVLVDAGTLTYRFGSDDSAQPAVNWREYFMGPRAHNGLTLDGLDPLGPLRGDFRGTGKPSTVVHIASGERDGLAFLEAEMQPAHGYPKLRRGVIHLPGVGFVVYHLLPAGDREISAQFQFAADCDVVSHDDNGLHVRCGPSELALAWSPELAAPQIARGSRHPVSGWLSPAYGRRVEAPQLVLRALRERSLGAVALLGYSVAQAAVIDCAQPTSESRAVRIRTARACHYVLLNVDPAPSAALAPIDAWDVRFRGRLLWARVAPGDPPRVRWIDGFSCDVAGHGSLRPAAVTGSPQPHAEETFPLHESQ